MSVELKKADKKTSDYRKIKKLYKKAFPAEERAPFFLLSAKAKKERVDFWGLYDGDKWVGLMYVVNYADLSYVFYFAVSESERGRGYGSEALKAAKAEYKGRKLFLAIEQLDPDAENYGERVRRKQFYQRNGFEELGQKLREASVIYELLGIGGAVGAEEYDFMMKEYLGRILSRLAVMKIIDE
ncbi:GNAT family N-acetyltransferase [Ruminococcus sp. Marseille-P6503]|uniref:GNAT family N-acetyltransferase n=1 Tax=Ruminococcus sp. Marseille-P6503 TaxID=2364796 RepID=UPI000F524B6B|nr:GNAT family N-acetyltransferase [Ruminococcus sp. Marseille-P6503]